MARLKAWLRRVFGPRRSEPGPTGRRAARTREGSPAASAERDGLDAWSPEIAPLEITDVLDLHTFPPREVPDLVRDWLDEAYEKGYREVRIIHGRGKGVQRRTVRTLLERDPRVVGFEDAPAFAGGWGATVVTLR